MGKKKIKINLVIKVSILTMCVLVFWYLWVFHITPFITPNTPTQIYLSVWVFPFLLLGTAFILFKLWKNDK